MHLWADVKTPLPPLSIGSEIWIWDENRRRYPDRKPGEAYGGGSPIFREHFQKTIIVGENRVSWIVSHAQRLMPRKISKKIRARGIAYSQTEFEDFCYCGEHTHAIAELVRKTSATNLRKIAAIIEYPHT